MTESAGRASRTGLAQWLIRLAARPGFQEFAARAPGLSWLAKRYGSQIFGIVQGFVTSQVLVALVSLDIPRLLIAGAAHPEDLAPSLGMSAERLKLLLRAGAGIGILKRCRGGAFALSTKGAALCGVPGLREMILHHGAFYRDMADPVALLKGEAETELAAVWPYVFGGSGEIPPSAAENYSTLMAESQKLVARDTLRSVRLKGISCLLDVGGGSGAFLIEVGSALPAIALALFDLPAVEQAARKRIEAAGFTDRIRIHSGSFLDDPLPKGADAVSLIRILYDHGDEAAAGLLRACYEALPPGGRLIISEPMSGGTAPDPITDVYFAFYALAMRTGRTRSADAIGELVRGAGFRDIRAPASARPYITSVLTAERPR